MATPSYNVLVEWQSGSFTELGEDVRALQITNQAAGLFDKFKTGAAKITVDNFGGAYSPSNTASALDGFLIPGKQVRIEATHSGSTYALFAGKIDNIKADPSMKKKRMVNIDCRDEMKTLNDQTITTSVFVNTDITTVTVAVLDAAGVASHHVHDLSNDILPFAWFEDRRAKNVIQDLVNSGFYRAYVDGGGMFHFHSRYWDQEGSVVSSFDEFFALDYQLSDKDVLNKVSVKGTPRVRDTDVTTIAWIDNPMMIPASGSIGFFLQYLDPDTREFAPADNQVTPVNSTDYQTFANSDGTGTEHTATTSLNPTFFGESAVCSIFNGTGSDVWLTKFQIRGQSIQRKPDVSYTAEDASSSQVVYGVRGFRLDNQLISDQFFVEDYANFLKDRQKNPVPEMNATFRNQFPDQLGMDMGVKLHLTDTHLGIADEFNIERIKHTVRFDKGGTQHDTQILVEIIRDQDVLILDHADYGKLDERKLGF
tara:strand:+ start:1566 stop:3008 length:1443 start_codon:yes stop_codon:yes gene_type:complete